MLPPVLAAILIASCDSTAAVTPVSAIQGSGNTSPLEGRQVTIEGTVTGDFQADDDESRNLGGFFLQGERDGDDTTSDGIFVYDGNRSATDVAVGDRVRVRGTVAEHFGETQVQSSDVSIIGNATVAPTAVTLPVTTTTNSDGEQIADLERFEGMLVSFPQTLTVSQLRNQERFGEIMLREGGRQYSYTNLNVPDVAGYGAHVDGLAARQVVLDDGLRSNNPGDYFFVRNGDEVSNLTGVLRYSRGSGGSGTEVFRLMSTSEPSFVHANPRPALPDVQGALRVACSTSITTSPRPPAKAAFADQPVKMIAVVLTATWNCRGNWPGS